MPREKGLPNDSLDEEAREIEEKLKPILDIYICLFKEMILSLR